MDAAKVSIILCGSWCLVTVRDVTIGGCQHTELAVGNVYPNWGFWSPFLHVGLCGLLQLEHLPAMGVWADDGNLQLEATTQFRKLLSTGDVLVLILCIIFFTLVNFVFNRVVNFYFDFSSERSPPIDEVIQSGVVPRFVEFLIREDFPRLQVWLTLSIVRFWLQYSVDGIIIFILHYSQTSVAWGSLGTDKYCVGDIWEHQRGDWSWGYSHFCEAS